MFQDLADILLNKVHPAIYDGVLSITQALEKHQAVRYKELIIQLRMDANQQDQQIITDKAIHIVYDQVRALLQQMRLELDLDVLPMDKLAMMLECLVFEQGDNDPEYLAALDAGEDTLETMAEIFAVYLQCDSIELMEYVTQVSGDTLLAVREKVEQNLSHNTEVFENVQETVQLVNGLQRLVGEKITVGMESLQSGIEVGASAEEMVKQLAPRLSEMKPDELADNLLSIAILAKTPRDALLDETMFFAENLIHDPFDVQKAYKRAKSRIAELPPEATP